MSEIQYYKNKDAFALNDEEVRNQVTHINLDRELDREAFECINNAVLERPEIEVYIRGNIFREGDWKWIDNVQKLVVEKGGWYSEPSSFNCLHKLKRLKLVNVGATATSFNLSDKSDLEYLEIEDDYCGFLKSLHSLNPEGKLKSLKLVGVSNIDDAFLRNYISPITSLEEVCLERLRQVRKLKFLLRLPKLRRLSLVGLKNLKLLKSLKGSSSLQELELRDLNLRQTEDEVLDWFPGVIYHQVSFAVPD